MPKPRTRQHNWALRGTITEEQGEIHVAQGKVIGGGSSINGQAMQRGFPEDFDSWAALGNDQWSYEKIVPYFRKSERDLDIQDNYCHGSDGPIPVRRRQTGPTPAIQQAFHAACVQAGFGTTNDKNGLHPAGLGLTPSNNLDGVRVSTAMAHLNPVRHHLNLTVRGRVFVRKILIKDGKAVGVEAESGGKVFQIEADRVVLSAGAIRSPHLLMLSGIGPEDHLRQFGIPTVHHLPGVGQNLMNHLSAQTTFKVKDGVSLAAIIAMRRILPCITPPKDRAPSTIWCCGPARLSTHGESASPAYGPNTWSATSLPSGRRGFTAR